MADISDLRKQVSDLNRERIDIINRVLKTKPFIAAQVYERFKKCGKKNCRCSRGELHGPFLWIYQNKKGVKVISTTVVEGKHYEAKELAKRYEILVHQRQRIREIDRLINEVLNELESHMEMEVKEYVTKEKKA
jgi:hypothetical protein